MPHHDTNSLAALIGSRICHDLISPIGAVNNGLELLELSGTASSPELALVAESVANANARIRFFRLAFGVASMDQMTGAEEVTTILKGVYADGRIKVSDYPDGSYPRAHVRATLLALLCAEQAVPYGGQIDIDHTQGAWVIRATADRLAPDPELWSLLQGAYVNQPPVPSAVQFLMLPESALEIRMNCSVEITDDKAEIALTPV
ncbi:MAG: histidine phosphotransferase family protein [Pseudomonadota bacterium]